MPGRCPLLTQDRRLLALLGQQTTQISDNVRQIRLRRRTRPPRQQPPQFAIFVRMRSHAPNLGQISKESASFSKSPKRFLVLFSKKERLSFPF
jgi:hypothetical protein